VIISRRYVNLRLVLWFGAFASGTVVPALAQNSDVDLIPDQVLQETPQADQKGDADRRVIVELTGSVVDGRDFLPQAMQPESLQARISANFDFDWDLAPNLRLSFGNRFNLVKPARARNSIGHIVQNDFRELYVTARLTERQVLDVGRINIKNGVAFAFSPTDYFRQGTTLAQTSADPAGVRAGRLGVFLARYQFFWDGGSVSVALAPELKKRASLGEELAGFDLGLDRTNSTNSVLLTASPRVASLNPQFSFLLRDGDWRAGLNASLPIGSALIVNGEWSGGAGPNLAAQLVEQGGLDLATLKPHAQNRFLNDAVLGVSWSNAKAKLTAIVEYSFHQGGLWRGTRGALFDLIETGGSRAGAALILPLVITGFEQDPLARHQAFVAVSRQDAGLKDLTFNLLVKANLQDGSFGQQVSASYAQPRWSAGVFLTSTTGRRRSEYGILPTSLSASMSIVRFF
jgi:hypothetical protein